MTLDEAIKHCEEKAEELRKQAEQVRDVGETISNPKQPYNEPVKACRECAKEHDQLAEWLKQLQKVKNIVEHWNDDSHSFVSACNAFESILDIFGKGVRKNE